MMIYYVYRLKLKQALENCYWVRTFVFCSPLQKCFHDLMGIQFSSSSLWKLTKRHVRNMYFSTVSNIFDLFVCLRTKILYFKGDHSEVLSRLFFSFIT